ncbi:hypothetical protein, partial [Streptomyces anulatus]|uniref:hypothetical protein n=1 Tax=Streptomyces anulatus TaxID=1892 RepID=UPI001941FD4D
EGAASRTSRTGSGIAGQPSAVERTYGSPTLAAASPFVNEARPRAPVLARGNTGNKSGQE